MNTADSLVKKVTSLPIFSPAAVRLLSLSPEEVHCELLVKEISTDPGLTAQILRLANTAYFGCRRKIETVHEASVMLGERRMVDLAIGAALGRVVPDYLPGYGITSTELQAHCLAVAICSVTLAQEVGLRTPPRAFCAGLLHDIGKLVIGELLEERCDDILVCLNETGIPLVEAESRVLGVDHTEVGEALANHWNLPPAIVTAIRYHHSVDAAPAGADRDLLDLVHVASALTHSSLGLAVDIGGMSRTLAESTLSRLNLNGDKLESVVAKTMTALDSARTT